MLFVFVLLALHLLKPLASTKLVHHMDDPLNNVSLLTAVLKVMLYNEVVMMELMKVTGSA